jgi:2-oxoglutarate dehydrogenase E2 component (dihydrolipoamide succinyltransferase)
MPDALDVILPADQSEGTTNVVGKWFKAVGDRVSLNEPLLEITTDKVTVEIAAPGAGVLAEILKQEGDSVERGEVLGRIGSGATAAASGPAVETPLAGAVGQADGSAAAPTSAPELSPAVRRLIQDHGLDASRITGTGRGGRITVQDVEAHLELATSRPTDLPSSRPTVLPSSRLVPHSAMRKSIAQHMVRSAQAAPHVTAVFEPDLSAVIAHRLAHKPAYAAEGVNLTLTAYCVRASVAALQAVPEVNSRWHEDALELLDDCNIGIATALTGGGLIVPVIHRAQDLDLLETARRLQDLTTRAREGKLQPKDVQGGTFTISNHGVSGSLLAAPIIINQPQSAILGVGKIERRVKVTEGGAMEPRPMAYVTLTIDHRVLDGFQANVFLTKWVETVERWT